ncbi:MAG TPA: hypothetical protein VI756_22860 [Blastocatellia bacterium]
MIDNVAVAKNPFRIVSSLQVVSTAAFYQMKPENDLTLAKLARAAEECHVRRDFTALEILGDAMIGTDREPERSVGQYYRSLVVKRLGDGDVAESERLLVECSPGLPAQYRPRTLMAHAHAAGLVGNRDDAVRLFIKAWRAGIKNDFCDLKTVVSAARFLNYWRATDGGARKALENLHDLLPMVRTAARIYPFLYYDHLDTMAYVAGMLGKWQEAKQMSDVVMTAPMAGAYPNWREHHEIFSKEALRRKSTIVVPDSRLFEAGGIAHKEADTSPLPEQAVDPEQEPDRRRPEPEAEEFGEPNIVSLAKWKAAHGLAAADGSEDQCEAPAEHIGEPCPYQPRRLAVEAAPLRGMRDKILSLLMESEFTFEEADHIYASLPGCQRQMAVLDLIVRSCFQEEIVAGALEYLEANRRQ